MSSGQTLRFPAINEWFDLAVGGTTVRAKLVDLGFVEGLAQAARVAASKGYRLLDKSARVAFMSLFPQHLGRPVVFGGSLLTDHDLRQSYVPCLKNGKERKWEPCYQQSEQSFDTYWLWAVAAAE